jgi:hypothetical protein
MIGLFQELGPCRINNQSTGVDLNPTSWNDAANVYVSITPISQLHLGWLSSVQGYSLTSPSELASRTELKMSIQLS